MATNWQKSWRTTWTKYGWDHDLLQARVDLVGVPHQAFLVLHPLEVADRDPAGIRENVREHGDTTAGQDFVSMRGRGAVGGFGDDAGFNGLGIVQGNDVFERRGNQNVALHGQQFVVADARGAGHANHGARALLVADGFEGIDAAGVGDAATCVAQGDDFGFLFREEAGGGGSGIAKALNRDTGPAQRNLFHLARFFDNIEEAACRGFGAPFGTADG